MLYMYMIQKFTLIIKKIFHRIFFYYHSRVSLNYFEKLLWKLFFGGRLIMMRVLIYITGERQWFMPICFYIINERSLVYYKNLKIIRIFHFALCFSFFDRLQIFLTKNRAPFFIHIFV